MDNPVGMECCRLSSAAIDLSLEQDAETHRKRSLKEKALKVLGQTEDEVKRTKAMRMMGLTEAAMNEATEFWDFEHFPARSFSVSYGEKENQDVNRKAFRILGSTWTQVKRRKALKILGLTEDEIEVYRSRSLAKLGVSLLSASMSNQAEEVSCASAFRRYTVV
eukprot:GILK01002130.1.p1 GENE.GILK01002130.1~~GILK01002130.1.p1  ORF type:complete len:164 (-),score=25.06 GILK01002130.1:188-679(-)